MLVRFSSVTSFLFLFWQHFMSQTLSVRAVRSRRDFVRNWILVRLSSVASNPLLGAQFVAQIHYTVQVSIIAKHNPVSLIT